VNGPVTLSLLASTDATADDADVSLGTITRTLRIKPNSGRRLSFRLPLPAGIAAGTYHVIARIDSTGTVTESNETNNDAASGGTFTVG
jgi:subtilase family serine protease